MGFIFVPPPGRSFGKDFVDAVSDTSGPRYFPSDSYHSSKTSRPCSLGTNHSNSFGDDAIDTTASVILGTGFVGVCLGVTLVLLFALWEVSEMVVAYTTGITFVVVTIPMAVTINLPWFTYETWRLRKHPWKKRLIFIFLDIPTLVVVAEFAFVAGAVVFGFISYCVLFFIAPFTGWSVEYALSVLVLTTKYFAFLISLGAVIWRYFAEFS